MYDPKLLQVLKDYGLSDKEANVYLSCLEMGSAPISAIAVRVGENRVTVYSILKSLKTRNIVTASRKNKMAYYSVIPPETLLKKLQDQSSTFESVLPEFINIAQSSKHPIKVSYFEGFEHMKDMYKDILQYPNTTVRGFWYSSVNQQFQDYVDNYIVPQRIKRNIGVNYILPQELYKELNNPTKEMYLRNIRTVPRADFMLQSDVVLYGGDKVLLGIFSDKQMSGALIQNQGLHNTLMSIFTALWHSLD